MQKGEVKNYRPAAFPCQNQSLDIHSDDGFNILPSIHKT
jgi:hypothetical protein